MPNYPIFTVGHMLQTLGKLPKDPEPKPKWNGSKPTVCDICHGTLGSVFYDASTRYGWALLCHSCFTSHRCKLGLGRGQKYNTKTLEKLGG